MAENTKQLLSHAAEMRSGGASWKAVADKLDRSIDTVKKWPGKFPLIWYPALQQAARDRVSEGACEGVTVLRSLYREDQKPQIRLKAVDILLKHTTKDRDVCNQPSVETIRAAVLKEERAKQRAQAAQVSVAPAVVGVEEAKTVPVATVVDEPNATLAGAAGPQENSLAGASGYQNTGSQEEESPVAKVVREMNKARRRTFFFGLLAFVAGAGMMHLQAIEHREELRALHQLHAANLERALAALAARNDAVADERRVPPDARVGLPLVGERVQLAPSPTRSEGDHQYALAARRARKMESCQPFGTLVRAEKVPLFVPIRAEKRAHFRADSCLFRDILPLQLNEIMALMAERTTRAQNVHDEQRPRVLRNLVSVFAHPLAATRQPGVDLIAWQECISNEPFL